MLRAACIGLCRCAVGHDDRMHVIRGPVRFWSELRRQVRCELPHTYSKFHGIRAIAAQPMRVRYSIPRVSNSVISPDIRVAG
jgi:hypothetical protein